MCRRETKCIDSIEATTNTRKYLEDIRLFEINDIMSTDHRSCVVDMNLQEFFQEDFSAWNKIERGEKYDK